jgi:methyl-accepting chemotaxis protein
MPETTGDLDQNLVEQLRYWIGETFPQGELNRKIREYDRRLDAVANVNSAQDRTIEAIKVMVDSHERLIATYASGLNKVNDEIDHHAAALESLEANVHGIKKTVADLVSQHADLLKFWMYAYEEFYNRQGFTTFWGRLRWIFFGSKP